MTEQAGLREVLLADAAANWRHRGRTSEPESWRDVVRTLGDIRFLPVVILRLGDSAHRRGTGFGTMACRALSLVNRFAFGVEAAPQALIGPGLYFPHTGGIVIGAASIGDRCVVYHQVTFGAKSIDMPFTVELRPTIGDDVVVAAGAKVLGGLHVGDRAVIGANAVVVDDVAADTVVGGVPARPLK